MASAPTAAAALAAAAVATVAAAAAVVVVVVVVVVAATIAYFLVDVLCYGNDGITYCRGGTCVGTLAAPTMMVTTLTSVSWLDAINFALVGMHSVTTVLLLKMDRL
eukprot:SAG31_NODE_1661_length_7596_cov_4.503802_5_plen_106_part_00